MTLEAIINNAKTLVNAETPVTPDQAKALFAQLTADGVLERHDVEVIRTHAETVMATLREAMQEAIAEAEVRGYKRQIDERLAAALIKASYKPPVPGLMGDVM